MARINNLRLSYDNSADEGVITFDIEWAPTDGSVGTPWDMLIEFIGRDSGEPFRGSNDLLARIGLPTAILGMPTESRRLRFRGSHDEDNPILFPIPTDPLGVDEVFVNVELLPLARGGATTARSNTISGVF